MIDKIFKNVPWDVISVIGFIIALCGVGILALGPEATSYPHISLALGFIFTFIGAIIVGGLPSMNKLFSKIKISVQLGLFLLGLILLFIQWKGITYFIETSLAWVLGAFISTSVIWVVKWAVTTE